MPSAQHLETPRIKFSGDASFQASLKSRVERYFARTGHTANDSPESYVKVAIVFSWLVASYVLLVFFASTWWQVVPLAVSLSLAMAAVGFCIQHDGGHRALSRHRWMNRIAACSLDLIGGSSYIWDHKHNTIHHTYANIDEHDDDINIGLLGRLAPNQRRLWFHRAQHIYLWLLYGLLPIKWHLVDDFRDLVRGRIGRHRFARPRGRALAILVGGKLAFLTLAFGIPLLFHPLWAVVGCYLLTCWITGLLTAVVFQLAHVVEPAAFPLPEPDTGIIAAHWAEHQVATTVNFAPRNRVVTWFTGGLNHQIEHHLFPRVAHVHYARLSRLVKGACERHGLRYNEHPGVFSAIASHYRWLRSMGQPA